MGRRTSLRYFGLGPTLGLSADLRTGQASAPAVKTVLPETTGLPRRWRDAYFFLFLLFCIDFCQFLFCCSLFPWILFFFWHIVYTVVCSLLLFLLFYIVNMYNCIFFLLLIFLTTTLWSPPFYLPFGEDNSVARSSCEVSCNTNFICHVEIFFFLQGFSQFTMHGFWVVWRLLHIIVLYFCFVQDTPRICHALEVQRASCV